MYGRTHNGAVWNSRKNSVKDVDFRGSHKYPDRWGKEKKQSSNLQLLIYVSKSKCRILHGDESVKVKKVFTNFHLVGTVDFALIFVQKIEENHWTT